MLISKHAEERYAERIMEYDEKIDRNIFIAQHKEKIEKDLNKMREYGTLLYSGKSLKDENTIIDIYIKDTWVLIVDKDKDLLVTIYKVDLKVDEEFTKEYINKILDKLTDATMKYVDAEKQAAEQVELYRTLIDENKEIIAEYKKVIKSLEEQNEAYQQVIATSAVSKKLADKEVRDVLMILTGDKSW